jgi:hypothetical protein
MKHDLQMIVLYVKPELANEFASSGFDLLDSRFLSAAWML